MYYSRRNKFPITQHLSDALSVCLSDVRVMLATIDCTQPRHELAALNTTAFVEAHCLSVPLLVLSDLSPLQLTGRVWGRTVTYLKRNKLITVAVWCGGGSLT